MSFNALRVLSDAGTLAIGMLLCSGCRSERRQTFRPKDASHSEFPANLGHHLNTARIDHLYRDVHEAGLRFFLHHGEMTDSSNLIRLVQQIQPDEIYNLAAQSHIAVSFEEPEYTANADALGTLRLLEAIRLLGLRDKTRFYQASTSELFSGIRQTPQNESTPSQRDWSFAGDFVRAMQLMVAHPKPDDYVLASGVAHSVRDFCEIAFQHVGLDYRDYVTETTEYGRAHQVGTRVGNPAKATTMLGWKPRVTFRDLVEMMIDHDMNLVAGELDCARN